MFGRERGCAVFEQQLLQFDGASEARSNDADDELLYVLAGTGALELDGNRTELTPGTAAYVRRGVPWRVLEADGLEVLSVLVREPLDNDAPHAIVGVDSAEAGQATAGRMFRLLAPNASVTVAMKVSLTWLPAARAWTTGASLSIV